MIEQPRDTERPVPPWVGMMVAVVLFGGLIAVAGYLVFDHLTQPARADLMEVPAIPQARISLSGPAPQQPGVSRSQGVNGQLSYTVRTTDATATISKSNAQPDWSFLFGYTRADLMTPDQTAAATARFRLMSDPGFARSLKVTDEQVAKLKAVPPVTTMIVSAADLASVKAAFEKYVAQTNSSTEQSLITTLQTAAASSLAPTRASVAERVKLIQAILTADQISPFKV